MTRATKDLEQLKNRTKKEYDRVGEITYPYLKDRVRFTSEGFQHLLYKGSKKRKERDATTQQMRLKLFPLALKVLKCTTTVQEHSVEKQFVDVKRNKRKEKVLKEVQYWAFIAIIDEWKLKVIVKQIGKGNKNFWSIVPNWKTRISKEGKKSYSNYSGNLEND